MMYPAELSICSRGPSTVFSNQVVAARDSAVKAGRSSIFGAVEHRVLFQNSA